MDEWNPWFSQLRIVVKTKGEQRSGSVLIDRLDRLDGFRHTATTTETERQTDRQTDRVQDTHIDRNTDTHTNAQTRMRTFSHALAFPFSLHRQFRRYSERRSEHGKTLQRHFSYSTQNFHGTNRIWSQHSRYVYCNKSVSPGISLLIDSMCLVCLKR